MKKPRRPTPDFPLFPHANGQWARKQNGKLHYYGPWADPRGALARYLGHTSKTTNLTFGTVNCKPRKPHPDYPLYAHACGKWAKKIRGTVHYFGTWDDPQKALTDYLAVKDDLLAGRTPINGGLTVRDLVNRFLSFKQSLVGTGEIKQRTWKEYHAVCDVIVGVFGKHKLVEELRPEDFSRLRRRLATGVSPTTLFNWIGRARVVFNFAWGDALIERPVCYGQSFRKPTQQTMRKQRAQRGPKLFKSDELRAIIEASGPPLRAMIYLGINCGLGNTDCMLLPMSAVAEGWLDFPRPKTGVERRAPLWPETLAALEAAFVHRPTPCREAEGRMFVTKYGNSWEPKSTTDNPITKEFRKVLEALKLHRPKLGFYALRHTFQTIGAMTLDKDAVRYIMGHVNDPRDMSAVYNEACPSDERLLNVTDFVRDWLMNTRLPGDRVEIAKMDRPVSPEVESFPRLFEQSSSEAGEAWRY